MMKPAFTIHITPDKIEITAHKTFTVQAKHLDYRSEELAQAITQMAADRLYRDLNMALTECKFIHGPVAGSA